MNLNSLKQFQDLDVEFSDLPIRIQNRMEEVDELVDELDESEEPNPKLIEKIARLDSNIVEMLKSFQLEHQDVEKQEPESKPESKNEEEKSLTEQSLPVVDTVSIVDDNVSENGNEEVAKKEGNPYFWYQP